MSVTLYHSICWSLISSVTLNPQLSSIFSPSNGCSGVKKSIISISEDVVLSVGGGRNRAGFLAVGDKEGILMRLLVVLMGVNNSIKKIMMGCLITDIISANFLLFNNFITSYLKALKNVKSDFQLKCLTERDWRRTVILGKFWVANWDKLDALITIIFMLVSSSETQVQVQDNIVNLGIYTSVSGEFLSLFSSKL